MKKIDKKINNYLTEEIHWKCVRRDKENCITIYDNRKDRELIQFMYIQTHMLDSDRIFKSEYL